MKLTATGGSVVATAQSAFTGQLGTFTGTDCNPADYWADVHWGDGTVSSATISAIGSGQFAILGSHTYAKSGSYLISVPILDTKGDGGLAKTPVVVIPSLQQSTIGVSQTQITAGGTTLVTLVARDANGNQETHGGLAVVFACGSATSVFSSVVNNGNGTYTAAFTGSTATENTISATINGYAVASPAPVVTVAAGPASRLEFFQQPIGSLVKAPINPNLQVVVEDSFGNVVASDDAYKITVTIGTNPQKGTLSGSTTATAVSGVAQFPGLSINKSGTGYTLKAASGTLAPAVSTSFNVTGPAKKLVFLQQPTTVTAGGSIGPAVKVAIEDAAGNILTADSSDTVKLAFSKNVGKGTLHGTINVKVFRGVATCSDLWIDKVGKGYTLLATSGSLSKAVSSSFNVNTGAASQLIFQQQAANALAGAAFKVKAGTAFKVKVGVADKFGNLLPSDTARGITITLATAAPAGGKLGGTTTVTDTAGVATFNNLSIVKAGTYTLQAASGSLDEALSANFTIGSASASEIVFVRQPPINTAAGTIFKPSVQVEDAYGNLVDSDNADKVTIALDNNPAGGKLSGATQRSKSSRVWPVSTTSQSTRSEHTRFAPRRGS